ncbi:TPA: hypothetical protein EYP37_07730 [Candidatus Poribacteria bacterium]|nr:hypothetical protein [Candidatus Poribacteria bacterium]
MLTLTLILAYGLSYAEVDDSWRMPLRAKAEMFERNILRRHWINGLYPSTVDLPPGYTGPLDPTTQGKANVAHSINWTSYYLGGQCYRYLFTKDENVREHCNKVFRAIYRCLQVTGVNGLLSRGYVLGHGPSYEEREGSEKSKYWRQGAPPYEDLRWRGDPSHHNYSGAVYGFGIFYDLVAQGEEREMCREAIDSLVGYWLDNDWIIWDYERKRPVPILGFTDGRTPNTRIIMAAAALKVAHHATGKEKFAQAYEKLVTQYGFRTYRGPIGGSEDFDEADHVFQHLENLFRLETDPDLRGFYRHVADELWKAHRDDCQSLFNYIYLSLVPDSPDREKAIRDALWTLRSWPTKRMFRPRMNSIRDDIEIVDGRSKYPLPMYDSPWDNEYQWKGNLYQLDGWLARDIVSLDVSREDEMVIFAADTRGDVYMSLDGADSWRMISENLNAHVKRLAAGSRVRFLFLTADDGFYKTTTAGTRWQRMKLPPGSGSPQDILLDLENPNVLYAVTSEGIYRSLDYGEEWIGERWENLSENLPPARKKRFHVALGKPARFYAILDEVAYRRGSDGSWERGETVGFGGYAELTPWMASDPQNPDRILLGVKVRYAQIRGTMISESRDGGDSWSASMKAIYERYRSGGMAALMEGFIRQEVNDMKVDPHDPSILYAATPKGVFKSSDGGKTWRESNKGLEIPLAYRIHTPIGTRRIFCSTPTGLFVSEDKGESWRNANLVLIFEGNMQREIGNADFLDAYWRGRYYNFITDEDDTSPPDRWDMTPPWRRR